MRRVDLETAQAYLDFTSRDGTVDRSLADLQLEASVALHNLLCERNSAYLADEVGMGKTYVALGVVALFRRANPNARVLYLSPRKNLQEKWVKELHQFVAHNCRQSDDRMRNRFGRPARPMVSCENLEAFAQECSLGQPRDVFLRTTSFSFGLAEEVDYHVKARTLVEYAGSRMPPPSVLRDKEAFKAWYGMELYRIAPVFDLVIVDEAHNLRRGPNQSDRNQMLNRMLTGGMGNPGPRKAANLLLVSATPFDRNMGDIYRQAQVFGHESGFEPLLPMDNPTVDSPERDRIFLESCMVRRLQAVQGLSRNQYRKEWRLGGMVNPETGMPDMDHLQQLMVALVQKKTCESIDNPEFGNAFQMGLLASFESFRESRRSALAPKVFDTKVEAAPPDLDIKNLAEREPRDREGIDSDRLEKVMLSFRRKFGYPMPHPKMKAVAEGLERSLAIGEKVLIFVNRVRSVDELKELLDLWIDRKVRDELMGRLPKSRGKWRDAYKNFQAEKAKGREVRNQKDTPNPESLMDANQEEGAVAEAFRNVSTTLRQKAA